MDQTQATPVFAPEFKEAIAQIRGYAMGKYPNERDLDTEDILHYAKKTIHALGYEVVTVEHYYHHHATNITLRGHHNPQDFYLVYDLKIYQ